MITHVSYEDWEQIFVMNELLIEGHSISAQDLLRALKVDYESLDLSVLPNDNFQIDNVAEQRSLAAVREALAE